MEGKTYQLLLSVHFDQIRKAAGWQLCSNVCSAVDPGSDVRAQAGFFKHQEDGVAGTRRTRCERSGRGREA
eukprot:731314-Rhodomonas_salina.1